MKKLILVLLLAAFACSPLITSEVQAAPGAKVAKQAHAARVQKLKQKVQKLKAKLHQKKANHPKLAQKKRAK